jgi:gamma-glutamylcyclotransferase (GGCT)/AIG2-like uncharacterized protein YtfP
MTNIFTYGSLMYRQVWNMVVEGRYRSTPATLQGYSRRRVAGQEYPVVYETPASSEVAGLLYYAVTDHDLQRLDIFEGDQYARQSVSVVLNGGEVINASVYVVKKQYHHIISDIEWDPDYFRSYGMQAFIDHYKGFNRTDR